MDTFKCDRCGETLTLNLKMESRSQAKTWTICKKCSSNYDMNRWKQIKEEAIAYKGGICEYCGLRFPSPAMQFHHQEPHRKEFNWAELKKQSQETQKKELDKCLLVCSNCHFVIHSQQESLFCVVSLPPSRFEDKVVVEPTCTDCGTRVFRYESRCRKCAATHQTRVDWPPTADLIEEIKETSFLAVGKKYRVSDNAVRKRLKNHPV